jgi:hypothetical protein
MFRTKEQLIEFLDRFWEKDDTFYIPLIYTPRELNKMYADKREELELPEPLDEAEVGLWAERMDYLAAWDLIEETASEQYDTIIEERGTN